MITYVNTVLVGKGAGLFSEDINTLKFDTIDAFNTSMNTNANKIVINGIDDSKFRVGIIINKPIESYVNGALEYRPMIKWSNMIKKADIKSFNVTNYNAQAEKEDTVIVDFSKTADNIMTEIAEGGKRIILRLTFKDLPTRFRKWTESYEYVSQNGDTANTIANGIMNQIKKNYKRARVTVEVGTVNKGVFTPGDYNNDTKLYLGNAIRMTAMSYTDDNTVDSISPANKVRFSANIWYTDPQAAGFASKNKYSLIGATVTKTPGVYQVGEWKLVRDAEAQAMGYQGVLNRGECTWPIIKPDMNVEMNATYDSLTLEFENMYRTADDLHRRTKQTLQIFEKAGEGMAAIMAGIIATAGLNENLLPEIKLTADTQSKQGKDAQNEQGE